jgi:hypothetical protein
VDARLDVYALGCVLYELLTGAPPFVADSPVAVAARQVAEAPIPPSRRNPQVGEALEAVVITALAKQPARRYQTASAMGHDLERIVRGDSAGAVPLPAAAGPASEPHGRPTTSPGSAPTMVIAARAARAAVRRPSRTRWPLLAGVGIVAVLLVVALWWLRDGDSPTVGGQAGPAATTSSTPTTTPTTQSKPACRRRWPV